MYLHTCVSMPVPHSNPRSGLRCVLYYRVSESNISSRVSSILEEAVHTTKTSPPTSAFSSSFLPYVVQHLRFLSPLLCHSRDCSTTSVPSSDTACVMTWGSSVTPSWVLALVFLSSHSPILCESVPLSCKGPRALCWPRRRS